MTPSQETSSSRAHDRPRAEEGVLPVSTAGRPTATGLPRLTLVIGGARSGKSRWAEAALEAAGTPACYIATGEARDAEMAERIQRHRERRGSFWTTVEEPLDLARRLRRLEGPALVDCLTLWLSNQMLGEAPLERVSDELVAALAEARGPLVVVANEVGLGIVPENALARRFRDEAGRLNQRVAAIADRVVLMAAGLPLVLKDC
jgi:adenosylcobinamide kinase/adenosylcobinamide-phosphate guanylyltransferase